MAKAKEIQVIRADIAKLAESEKITKQLLGSLASDVLVFLHEHGQSGVMNETLRALSPVNAKAAKAFFTAFSGFAFSKEDDGFTKKIKPTHDSEGKLVKDAYADAKIAFNQFLDEGGNFWTWYKDSQKVEKPEEGKLDLAKLTTTVKNAAKKAAKQGVSKTALFNAIISDVFSPDDILEMLTQSVNVNKVVVGELKDKAVPDAAKAA